MTVLDKLRNGMKDNKIAQLIAQNKIKLIMPEPKVDFSVYVTMCVHRQVDPDVSMRMLQLLACPNPKMVWGRVKQDAMIQRARSKLASDFLLQTDHSVFFSLDDDIVFDPLDVVRLCKWVHEGKYDIIGGAYVARAEGGGGHIMAKPFKGQQIRFAKDSEPVEVRMLPTGFMAVSRRVFETMAKDMPLCHPDTLKIYPFFYSHPREIDGKWVLLSEDWGFCELARERGFKVYLDPSVWLKHSGKQQYDLDDLKRERKTHYEVLEYTEP